MIHRPFDQPAAEVLTELELKRARTGQFDRLGHPQVLSGAGGEQRVAAIFVVEQHPEAGASVGDATRGADRQHLERGNARYRRLIRRQILQLNAMIDGERHQARIFATPRRRPMDVVQRGVLAQRPLAAAVIEEMPSSGHVGYSGEQSSRDTAKAPQALAQVAEVARASPRSQPRRKPDMKASPAPSTLNTSIGNPLPTIPASRSSGIGPS